MKTYLTITLISLLAFSCTQKSEQKAESTFEVQLDDYFKKFPYQVTYNYMHKMTGGKASNLNVWVLGKTPVLVKAGKDKVVRMNNDTFYKVAFMDFSNGFIKLNSSKGSDERFSSFQLMDDHNANFKNIIHPQGDYCLYFGDSPIGVERTLIESPSKIAVVIVRVEVRDTNNEEDIKQTKETFSGIDIQGPKINEFPSLDLLSAFDEKVATEATRLLDSTVKVVPFRLTLASPDQVPGTVSYINFAAGTKGGYGGPLTSHSSYEVFFFDNEGNTLDRSKGYYTLTTSEPPMDAFWSITVYDTERGGFLHPNAENKYHINNTSAIKNEKGIVTFLFKTQCEDVDVNCLSVPAGEFDLVARYYLPNKEIQTGKWKMPNPQLVNNLGASPRGMNSAIIYLFDASIGELNPLVGLND